MCVIKEKESEWQQVTFIILQTFMAVVPQMLDLRLITTCRIIFVPTFPNVFPPSTGRIN
jgi:hypothetical protein